ncbi:ribbon-helix-helix domain-containing protein [Chelativorans salis]|uniref:Ribbon-helix-helix domain-containing protein n=1 Tax=Chelativorans salis TaxID=2978478 RepID=A0ABT2LKC8_9HYPH|nr:ribbon-helix-helix domain-containing protein [Chelativorans sp. EGI FJ00035]MCT7375050.1 ribbon-helix-helix domain-containing protein [Chelativorans sp. EGI FJ00035]
MVPPQKRSVTIRGHRTSFSLEDAFYSELERLARKRGLSVAALIAEIDAARTGDTNLSSALRLYVLDAVKRGQV